MTAQVGEIINFEGEYYSMCTEPLGQYFDMSGKEPNFQCASTANWRGYIGEWEIRDDRLYLIGLEASYADGSKVTLDSLFPGYPDRVFAHWYSGTARLPEGEILDYVHMGYGSTFERDILFEFEKGVLVAKTVCSNTRDQ